MLGEPLVGRAFLPEERSEPLAILDYDFWQARYDGSPSVLGRTLDLGGRPHTIVGVMPKGFHFPSAEYKFWVTFDSGLAAVPTQRQERSLRIFGVVARLPARGDRGASQGRAQRLLGAAGAPASGLQSGGALRAAADPRVDGGANARRAARPAGHRGPRPADRLRERREHAPGADGLAAGRAGRADGARGDAPAPRATALVREPGGVGRGRSGRSRAGGDRAALAAVVALGGDPAARFGPPEPDRSRLHFRPLDADGPDLRGASGLLRSGPRSGRGAEGGRTHGFAALRPALATGARGARDRARDGRDGRRGSSGSELDHRDPGGSGVRAGSLDDRLGRGRRREAGRAPARGGLAARRDRPLARRGAGGRRNRPAAADSAARDPLRASARHARNGAAVRLLPGRDAGVPSGSGHAAAGRARVRAGGLRRPRSAWCSSATGWLARGSKDARRSAIVYAS